MISKRRRNKPLKRILLCLSVVFKTIRVIMRIIKWPLIFNYSVSDDSVTIDKLQFANMNVFDRQWHPGYNVMIVDKTVDFYIKFFFKNLIAHSGRTKCVDSLGITVPAGEKRCQAPPRL